MQLGPYSFTSGSISVASGRVAYAFGMQGPSASVNTVRSHAFLELHACALLPWQLR